MVSLSCLLHFPSLSLSLSLSLSSLSPSFSFLSRYDMTSWNETCCEVYADAYAAQWSRFAALCDGGETGADSDARMEGYRRTFEALEQAAEVLGFGTNARL